MTVSVVIVLLFCLSVVWCQRLSCGSVTTCFVTRFNATRCWGYEKEDRLLLGHGNLTHAGSGFAGSLTIRQAGDVSALPLPTVSVHTAEDATCALIANGTVYCWGYSSSPILTDRRNVNSSNDGGDIDFGRVPSPVGALQNISERVTQLALGRRHACALLESHRVSCWGDNTDGQLGFGSNTVLPTPDQRVYVPLKFDVAMLAAGQSHTCALSLAGDVFCWGSNSQYQLGTTQTVGVVAGINASLVPLRTAVYSYIASGARHMCAIERTAKTLHCWGLGSSGRLGYGNSTSVAGAVNATGIVGLTSLPPVPLNGTVSSVACGSQHTCVLYEAGGVQCFGQNATGRLGYPTGIEVGASTATTPDKFSNIDLPLPAVAVSAGDEHACAVLNNGRVYCWGAGNAGQLGYNNASLNVGSTISLLPKTVGPVDVGDDPLTTTTTTTTTTAPTTTATTVTTTKPPEPPTEPVATTTNAAPVATIPGVVEEFPWWAILIIVLSALLCSCLILLLILLFRKRNRDDEEVEEKHRKSRPLATPRDDEYLTTSVVAFEAGTTRDLNAVAVEEGTSSSSSDSSEQHRKRKNHKKSKH